MTKTLLPITNIYFAKGYHLGRCWVLHGEVEIPVNDMYVIENILNLCTHRLLHDTEWLSEHVGFLIGMISGGIIPEEEEGVVRGINFGV